MQKALGPVKYQQENLAPGAQEGEAEFHRTPTAWI
jgi:hypothetical protein